MRVSILAGLISLAALARPAAAQSSGRSAILDLGNMSGSNTLDLAKQTDQLKQRARVFPSFNSSFGTSGVVELKIETLAEIVDYYPPALRKRVEDDYKSTGEAPPNPGDVIVYKYTYIFSNSGTADAQLNVSNEDFLSTPFTDVVGGFQFTVPAGKTRTISYLAIRAPKVSPFPISVRYRETNGFQGHAGAAATLYYPDWFTPYLAVANDVK